MKRKNFTLYVKFKKKNAAKKLLKSSQTTIAFLYLIMEHKEGNIGKKIQPLFFVGA